MSKVKKTVALLLTFSLIFGVYQLHLQSLERQEARLSESFEDRVASLNRSYKERIGRVANESYREGFKDAMSQVLVKDLMLGRRMVTTVIL